MSSYGLPASPHVPESGVVDSPRAYFRWRWNSPGDGRPPMLMLEIDSLQIGHILNWRISPKQASDLCNYGLESVELQRRQFGDAEPRDYDVRLIP